MSVFEEVEISALKAVIARYKPIYATKEEAHLPSFIVKAVVQALKHHPQLNLRLMLEQQDDRPQPTPYCHCGGCTDGLVVPVIRDDRFHLRDCNQIVTLLRRPETVN